MTYGYVYILRCKDDSLYTGWCVDVKKRLALHNSGKGAKYTRSKRPCKLVYYEEISNKSEALKREIAIKKLSKAKKEDLVRNFNLT
ncbi:GIY-YIG nuclease family protein [Anaerococcus sp. mt242]|uniref:GIY-YIG nuclease family protein n=1 Tax=unclassified Anaerococcus TaxID=2614126 RepID=UPI001932D5D5|nr:GIY-YIG nuclease family protein [Anaerococcus sp. mt242]MBM0045936.1 GIY-YIG nuclease family protein [Anaerococcus sp. mt242]